MTKRILTQDELKLQLHYDPLTGIFTRLVANNNFVKPGETAGSLNRGYNRIKVHKILYEAHRLAWLYVYGYFPIKHIDHIDTNRSNNKILNLREATRFENLKNVGVRKHNKSGFKGVSLKKGSGKWCAQAQLNRKKIHIGYFATPEEASVAYESFAKENFGEFYRAT